MDAEEDGIFLFKTSTARVAELSFDAGRPEPEPAPTVDAKKWMGRFLRRFCGRPGGPVQAVSAAQVLHEARRFLRPTPADSHIAQMQNKTRRASRRHKRRTRAQRQRP